MARWQSTGRTAGRAQHGVVLLFALIALAVMLIAAMAVVRSFNGSLSAGSIALRSDMQNQSERAVDHVLTAFRRGGALFNSADRVGNVAASNYSATMLPSGARGIPTALLLSDREFAANYSAPDLESDDGSVKIRYVVDRLCGTTGDEVVLDRSTCFFAESATPFGTSSSNLQGADRAPLCSTCASAEARGVVFRLSIRVTGGRRTQLFFQSTFTAPSSTWYETRSP